MMRYIVLKPNDIHSLKRDVLRKTIIVKLTNNVTLVIKKDYYSCFLDTWTDLLKLLFGYYYYLYLNEKYIVNSNTEQRKVALDLDNKSPFEID